MLIVSDTGPLRYLIETAAIDALPRLFGSIRTTSTVIKELSLSHFPTGVREWATQLPGWLLVDEPSTIQFEDVLDAGEASAISLALERHADMVLIDERSGTTVAHANGLRTIGSLAVLQKAGIAGMIDFHEAIRRLTTETQFRHTRKLIDQVIADFDRAIGELNDQSRPSS
jgi:predicted nucleic acid-binding protein